MRDRRGFLANRTRTLLLAGFACMAALLLLWTGERAARGASLLPPALGACTIAALGAAAWFGVVKPYEERERTVQRLLRGYAGGRAWAKEVRAISASDAQLLCQIQALLDPSQIFRLNKRQAQYLALQNQTNPHFLYNTLESIRSEAMLAGLSSVADMTEALANFFRYTISKVENLVSVEEELQNCETYFHIQRYRFGDRLELSVECSPEDREELYRCRLPKLTLQPILENSIIHGTELKVGVGHLTIFLQRTGRRLLISVSDDGVGMDEETLARLNGRLGKGELNAQVDSAGHSGVALVNVDNRIRLLFGEEYGLHVFSMPGLGTTVEITLPIITSDRDVKNKEVLG